MTHLTHPLVIKYDGLADGKGVCVAQTLEEAQEFTAKIDRARKERVGNCWRIAEWR